LLFSCNWIRELVEGVEVDAGRLGLLLTMKTAECEGVHAVGDHLEQVCAARILTAAPLPGGQHWKAEVETGRYGIRTVICGAPNCRAGLVSAYVPAGVTLAGERIEVRTIGGVSSDGMLASGAELGLNRDAESILELDAAPGEPVPGCPPDNIIEIDNKSITHRPDLWGHHGMAREVAAILRRPLAEPVPRGRIPEGPAAIGVAIEDFDLCPRYSALVFEGVTVRPSPLWLQYRLQSIGLNPINNIVDVTNYVMAEIAQPMHAFDADKLAGRTIFIRRARQGETVVALNEESYTLAGSSLVIADASGAVAIAGVIGGLPTGITAGTTRLVLESANFQAAGIRRTSSQMKLRTDASMRFEKAQDPVNTVRGLARAVELLELVSPGIRLTGGLADSWRPLPAPDPIPLPLDWLERKLGRTVDTADVRDILTALEFGVTETAPRVFLVTVPSWRATKDISIKDDLVEEVGRMVGYDTITPTPPAFPSTVPPANPDNIFHHEIRALASAQGFTEARNYSFVSEQTARAFEMDPDAHLRVTNPISSEQGLLRISLVPGIWKNVVDNSRHFDSFRLFEIGYEIHKRPDRLPDEIPHLAGALYQRDGDGQAGLLECKRLAECILPGVEVSPVAARSFEHPARSAELLFAGQVVGRLFEMHPEKVSGRAAVVDLDLAVVRGLRGDTRRFRPLRRFPSSGFDLSVVTDLRELAAAIEKRLVALAGGDLESIQFLRQYSGPPLAEGKKSVSFHVSVCSPERTLSSEDVAAIRNRIIDGMREAGYELRL